MTANFQFTPAVGYTNPYTIVAYGTANPSIPKGQVVISGYGSMVTGSISGLPTDTKYTLKIYSDVCTAPAGQIDVQ